ncbi:MAG TPA: hypothetical protein GX708_21135 [Gallicola sp.]|nr:hypothetical protein [Gallicola sp.]
MKISDWLNSSEEFLNNVSLADLAAEYPGMRLSHWDGSNVALKRGDSKAIFVLSQESMGSSIEEVVPQLRKGFTLRKGSESDYSDQNDDFVAVICQSNEDTLSLDSLL